MANANIKISQLPNIGSNLNSNTLLPVVSTNGTFLTDKVTVGNLANFILDEAGNTLANAFVASIAYSVANAAQPNITSVGNLTGLTITNLSNLHIPGGTNGYVLQTNGNGNLNWTALPNGGNGAPGGSNTQVQFNDSGVFNGSSGLVYDKTTFTLGTVNLQASSATIYDDISTTNINATGNISSNLFVGNGISPTGANFFIGNLAFNDSTIQLKSGANNQSIRIAPDGNSNSYAFLQIPDNDNAGSLEARLLNQAGNVEIVAGDLSTLWAWYFRSDGFMTTPGPISASGDITTNGNVSAGNLFGDGGNISNISGANIEGTVANANYAMHVDVTPTSNNFSYHVVLVENPGDNNLAVDGDDNLQYNPADGTLTTIRLDTEYLNVTYDVVSNLIPFSNVTYDLGNNTNRWKDIYLSNSSIYLGDATISANGNSIVVDSITVTNGNVGTIGNIASINLDGSSSNVLYGNGVFAPAAGGLGSELVNGDNSFVLDNTGNVVFEGDGPGDGVNRGLVWDYGANANGVNSEVRQDNSGITVRAWTENGGGVSGYAAPVNIVTNQDATENRWIFDGDGELILPGNMILAAGNIRSNAISPAFNSAITGINSGNANVIITIAEGIFEGPFSGQVTISGVNPPVQVNGDWWYQAVEFDQFQLFTDANLTIPVDGTDWPGYVDGGTAVGVGTYSDLTIQGGNVTIGSNANTWIFGSDGNLTIPNDIVSNTTIDIDNRASGNTADIRLYAADDILLQARDRALGSGTEGGDINIYAGDSAEDGDASGGDIQIFAGDGGAANVDFGGTGGFITIRSGRGGSAIGDGVSRAESGGSLTLEAGDSGGNNGNIDRGAAGGDVFIAAGDSTGNLDVGGDIFVSAGSGGSNAAGGDIQLTTGPGGSNAAAGNVRITIPSSDRGAGGTWTFDGTGNLIVPPTGYINGSDGAWVRIQSLEEGNVRSSVTLNPGDGATRLESWDNQSSQSFTSADWTTGEYIDNGGGSGEIVFTDTPTIRSFFDTIFTSDRLFYQVNGGNLLPSIGWGGGGDNITFYTAIPPADSPEAVTDFVIYYSYRSIIEMDYDEGELNIQAQDLDINITSNQEIDIQSSDRIRIENSSNVNGIYIATDTANAFRSWTFGVDGSLTLPAGGVIGEGPSPSYLGDAVTITPAGGNDPNQQLKIYPTTAEGNHLHLTSGNLAVTDVFLGDDRQYIRTTTTEGMIIGTGGGEIFGGYVWSFEENGNLIFPDGASIGSGAFNGTASSTVALNAFSPDGNIVSIQAQGNTSSAVISIFSNAGPVTSNWTFTTAPLDPSESILYVPPGAAILTPAATGGEGGKNIFIQAGASDPETWNSNPGGELFIKGGYGSFGDGGGGAGGNVNIEGGSSSDSHAGNVNINSGLNTWVFDYTGNLTLPGQLVSTTSDSRLSLNENGGGGAYLTSTDDDSTALFLRTNDVQMYAGINQTITAGTILPGLETDYSDSRLVLEDLFTQNEGLPGYPWGITLPVSYLTYNELILLAPDTFPNQAACTVQANNTNNRYELWQDTIADTNVTITANENSWLFDNNGNLTLPGDLIAATASPAPRISGFSSVSALQFTNGNSNVTINANSNLWTFDSTGNLIIPGSSGGVIKTVANGAIAIAAIDNGSDNPAQVISFNANGTPTTAISSYANQATIQANINGDIKTWAFTNAGNLVLPGNTFAVNYANGTQVSLGGGGSSIANGNSNVNIATANGNVTIAAVGNNVVTITGTGANITGTANITGNLITGGQVQSTAFTGGNIFWTANNQTDFQGAIKVGTNIIRSGGGATSITLNNNGANMGEVGVTLTTSSTSTTTGALKVAGGAGIVGNIYVGGIANITGNLSGGNAAFTGNVTANNFSGNISITGNVQGTSANVELVAGSYTYTFDNAGAMTLPAPTSGNEGGEIQFTQAANSTLSGNTVTVDSYVDQIRFFEGGGTARGAYIDLSQAAAGVGTLLNNRVSTIAGANTAVTINNIQARVGGSPTRLYVNTVSGNLTGAGTSQTMTSGSMAVSSWINVPIGQGAANAFAMSGAISTNGDTVVLNLVDQGAGSGMWRITGMIANTAANLYSVTIEKLA